MHIIFIGTVKFYRRALECLINITVNTIGVCLQLPKVYAVLLNLNIMSNKHEAPCLNAEDINFIKTLGWIQKKVTANIFCLGWISLIKLGLLNPPLLGVISFHSTALKFLNQNV